MAAFGAKYDVSLQAVTNEDEPGSLFWTLKQVRVVDPNTPSTSVLSSDMDLTLDIVNVSAVYPDLATVANVCLKFQGWDQSDLMSMTWKYISGNCQ